MGWWDPWSYTIEPYRGSVMKIGDLVQHKKTRLGIVVSEVFDMRPKWTDEHPAVQVHATHGLSGEWGTWLWLLEDIEVISESR